MNHCNHSLDYVLCNYFLCPHLFSLVFFSFIYFYHFKVSFQLRILHRNRQFSSFFLYYLISKYYFSFPFFFKIYYQFWKDYLKDSWTSFSFILHLPLLWFYVSQDIFSSWDLNITLIFFTFLNLWNYFFIYSSFCLLGQTQNRFKHNQSWYLDSLRCKTLLVLDTYLLLLPPNLHIHICFFLYFN